MIRVVSGSIRDRKEAGGFGPLLLGDKMSSHHSKFGKSATGHSGTAGAHSKQFARTSGYVGGAKAHAAGPSVGMKAGHSSEFGGRKHKETK